MVNVTLEDLYMEIRALNKQVGAISALLEDVAKVSESTSTVTVTTNKESVVKKLATNRELVVTELSQMKFKYNDEAEGILESYGFEKKYGGSWFINTTLHLSCRIVVDYRADKWKIVFSNSTED